MADNITLDSMSGGSVVATDDIGGVHYQIVKLAFGALDAQTIVSGSDGLPVELVAGSASIGTLGANSGVDIGDVTINNASGASAVNIQDGGNSITIDGTVTANLSATDNAVLDNIDTNTGNAATSLAVLDDWDNAASDGVSVSGDVAHDGADAGEPVKIGGKALDVNTEPSAVAANDRVNASFLRNGLQAMIGGSLGTLSQNLTVTDADGAQTDTAIITVSAGTAIVVTAIEVTADNANTGDCGVRIGFGTANTPAQDAAKVVLNHTGIAAGSGIVKGNGGGIIGIGASNEDLRVTCEDPAGGNLSITVTYFTVSIG